ncbi:hypothetical protein L7F22_028143 [Adiantum nelumboides]|nr:hypothetical protein [Adiantum nelumboides]
MGDDQMRAAGPSGPAEFDVFWCHSGEQKPFVTELNRQLREARFKTFNNFLDTQINSLPPAESFPVNISRASKAAGWQLTPDTIAKWTTALPKVRVISGAVLASDTVDVLSPNVRRLLSNIRLLLAAAVLREQQHEMNDEKLQAACEDINNELDMQPPTYVVESAALLIKRDAIPNLVAILRTLCRRDLNNEMI